MYENLISEMAKLGIAKRDIASCLGIHENTVAYKLNHGSFSVEEAFKIKHSFFKNYELEYLFHRVLSA